MKILLDIDGVMIPAKPWESYEMMSDGFGKFTKHSVDSLNNIISNYKDIEIILTTSHKHTLSINEWRFILNNRGFLKTELSILNTNSLELSRIDEIKTWYEQNENEKFIIIDDDKSLNDLAIRDIPLASCDLRILKKGI